MKKITILTAFVLLLTNTTFSQEIYKRVTINNVNDSTIQQLDQLGIDLTCGVIITDDHIQIELGQTELDRIESNNITYNVLIEDMTKFYSDRAASDLPKARLELEQEKILSAQKSYSLSEIINNVGQYNECDEIDWTTPQNWNLNPNGAPNSFGGCLTYDMVLQELDDMRSLYPNLISAKANASPTNQLTIENRTMYYVRISDNPDTDEAAEPETLYQSLIHSRESATIMNQLYFMWYLLENYDSDPAIKNLINNHALYFIPVFNPDGFVYNETQAPDGGGFQRKNRNTSGGCTTYADGIDLNRNSAYYWGNGGASTSTCNDTYLGSAPFSENETQIMRDFFLLHDFKLALNHHSFKNAMLHAYAGTTITNPRPDEYSKYNHDMTEYNRYAHGPSTSISSLNSGNMNDWMLGGPAGTSANGTPTGTGSGKNTLAWTPENGISSEAGTTGSGFWPAPSNFLPIAKRAMRMNFLAAYFSGKYAKLHDLNQSNITAMSGNLEFAIENLGQNGNDTTPNTNSFTVTVTAETPNITINTASASQNFTAAELLDQKNVAISYTLDAGVQADDIIKIKVTLTNDYATDNILYESYITKHYTPNVIFDDNTNNLSNWNAIGTGGTWNITSDAYTGSAAIISTNTIPYANDQANGIQLTSSVNLTGVETALIQFYAKWDLERSFDYVQLEGSLNGTSGWTPLCGKLTKPGAPDANNSYSGKGGVGSTDNDFQPDGEALYDGDTQDKWNMEEIVIDASTNSFLHQQNTVFLRFVTFTDSSNRKDSYANADFEGFTFDEFKIIEIQADCDSSTPPVNLAATAITSTTATANWDEVVNTNYDLRYRETSTSTWTDVFNLTMNTYNFAGLSVATEYEYQVRTNCGVSNSSYSSSYIFETIDPCTTTINMFTTDASTSYSENFDSGLGDWEQDTMDDLISTGTVNADWAENSGQTPSTGTGPSQDYTAQTTASTGNYFYVESSTPPGADRVGNDVTLNLISPCFDLTGFQDANFTFYYHRFGNPMGDLRLDVSTDGGTTWTTENTLTGQQQTDNTDDWIQQNVDLSAYDGMLIKLRFSGTTPSSGFVSDMAIDEISLTADVDTLTAESFETLDFTVYPNPFNDDLTIKLSNNINNNLNISIYDISGRTILSLNKTTIQNNEIHLENFNALASGSYFLKLSSKSTNTSIIKRIIKK